MSNRSPAIALTEPQMLALLAASYPLPPQSRGLFLEACAREIANLLELGDGLLHRTIGRPQNLHDRATSLLGWVYQQSSF